MLSLDDVLSHLDNVKEAGKDQWIATCPCHDDKTPSLSIRRGTKVAFLLKCFACGAKFTNILDAIDARIAGVR